jgi:hypothetical protein
MRRSREEAPLRMFDTCRTSGAALPLTPVNDMRGITAVSIMPSQVDG